MGNHKQLQSARAAKKDEFYTLFDTIEAEIKCYDKISFKDKTIFLPCDDPYESNFFKYFSLNFKHLKLKKLIATCYNGSSKINKIELAKESFSAMKDNYSWNEVKKLINIKGEQLKGNGDFRSEEITLLRDEADIIVTNPPFSLFRDFAKWVLDAEKSFIILGNQNAITYREIFPHIAQNKIWLGASIKSGATEFIVPDSYEANREENGIKFVSVSGIRWFTNLNHNKRNEIIPLMSMEYNLKHNNKIIKSETAYKKFNNYDVIEVPHTKSIPSDYYGVMAVPITFIDKYNPEQFEIVGFYKNEISENIVIPLNDEDLAMKKLSFTTAIPGLIKNNEGKIGDTITYARITIRHKKNTNNY